MGAGHTEMGAGLSWDGSRPVLRREQACLRWERLEIGAGLS